MTPDITCLDCPHCYDDDEALYCGAETCVMERGQRLCAHDEDAPGRLDGF